MVDSLWNSLISWVLPPSCLLCGNAAHRDIDLCATCVSGLGHNAPACLRCALPLGAWGICGRCTRRPPAFDRARAACVYDARARVLMPGLKYAGQLAVARTAARVMLDRLELDHTDALVPVPLHPHRLATRGYNQALELARPLSRATGFRLRPELLIRAADTPAQTGLTRRERVRNLRAAFRCETAPPPRVALIDDVMTTGATLDECARTLKRAGADYVEVWVFARAPPPR
jgi:ComF family protein